MGAGVLCVAAPAGAWTAPPRYGVAVVTYRPPVDAPVIDAFRPPAHIGAPGNRGLEYATRPGTAVRAAAPGIVSFAGKVGPDRHVTVAHPDGVRTSYSRLATVAVRSGQRVGAGHIVGTAGASLHFGARIGEAYVDPAVLLGATGRARLVPVARLHASWAGGGRSVSRPSGRSGRARRPAPGR